MSTLEESKLRIDWAREKLEYLEFARDRVWKDALHVIAQQADPNPRDVYFLFRDNLRNEAIRCVSEFVHHARSALDYVVYALARRDSGKNFRPEKDRTQFPINESPEEFAGKGKGMLKHLTPEHITMIEQFQPYKGFYALPLLNRLSNVDKHREFVSVTFIGRFTDVIVPVAQTEPPASDAAQMKVQSYHPFLILLDDGSDIKEALSDVLSQVRKVVDHFDRVLG